MLKIFKNNFNLKITAFFILSAVILFFCTRLALFIIFNSTFSSLTAWQVFKAFLNGFRFDYSVIGLFLMPCLLMLNLPIKSRLWFKIWAFISSFVLFLFAVILLADLVYFPEVHRHIAQEIIQIKYEFGFIVNYAITQCWFLLFPLLALLALAFWFFNKKINQLWQAPEFKIKNLLITIFVFAALIVLGVRGHLGGGKSLGMADVYNYAKTQQEAILVMNGAFSAYQVGRKGKTESTNNYPFDKALAEVQALFKENGSEFKDKNYPLMQFPQEQGQIKDINFFIIMLEGWAKYAIGAYNPEGDTHTPYFDEMAKNGVLFTNAYATGQRSILGFTSIFAGLPLINSLPMFGYGLEQNAITKMPQQFRNESFYTFYAHTSNRDSYRMCALANLLGAKETYGAEDIPLLLKYQGKPQFGYDYDTLMFAADKIKARREDKRLKARRKHNFLAMTFTGTTHDPFVKLTDDFEIFKDGSWQSGYKNAMAYADYALGSLIKRAKEDGWFDNTVFIFLSDHIGGRSERKTIKEHFEIPLLIYAPKILKPQVITYPVSQLDIMPTVYALSGLNAPRTFFGNNLLNDKAKHFAMISTGVNNGIITKDGVILYDGKKIIEQESFTPAFDAQKSLNMLLALDKVAANLLEHNKWYNERENEK